MNTHDTALALAAAAIDFGLTQAERARLDAHLAACPACARSAVALRADALVLAGLPGLALPERRSAELLSAALHPARVRHPLRLVAIAALLALLALGSLAVGAELLRRMDDDRLLVLPPPTASAAPDASAEPSASAPAEPGATIATLVPLPVPPPIDASFRPPTEDGTPGAFVLRLGGALSGIEVTGNATCEWGWETGRPDHQGISADTVLLGEELTIYARGSLVLNREGTIHADYALVGASPWVSSDPTLWTLTFRDLALNLADEPEDGPAPADFYAPLGGRSDAARLDGVLAWRCEAPTSPPPTPYAAPLAVCPAPATPPAAPVVTARAPGSPPVRGMLGSFTVSTCSTVRSDDRVVGNPTQAIEVERGQELTVQAPSPWRILHWEGFDGPLAGEGGNVWPPVDLGDGTDAVVVPGIDREGDSVLTLTLTMSTTDGRAVGTFPFSFLVRVAPS
jgi:hypothetical protein